MNASTKKPKSLSRLLRGVFVIIGVLALGTLAMPVPAAADFICACYDKTGACTSKTSDNADAYGTQVKCSVGCQVALADKLDSSRTPYWDADSTSEAGKKVAEECKKSDAAAKATLAAQSTAPPEPPRSFVIPNLGFKVPGVTFSQPAAAGGLLNVNFISEYLSGIYRALINISTAVAIVMVMIAGVQYVIAAGSGEVSKAKERIKNAVIGLVLLLGAYVILFTVNPDLVLLQTVSVEVVDRVPLDTKIMESAGGPPDAQSTGTGMMDTNFTPKSVSRRGFNNVPYFQQGEAPWGGLAYGDMEICTVAKRGQDPCGNDKLKAENKEVCDAPVACCSSFSYAACGVTSLSMLLANYGEKVDPRSAAIHAIKTKTRVCNAGTVTRAFTSVGVTFPRFRGRLIKKAQAIEILKKGYPVAATTFRGMPVYSPGGHWIVLTGIDSDGRVHVNDPAGNSKFANFNGSNGFWGEPRKGVTMFNGTYLNNVTAFVFVAPDEVMKAFGL